MGCALLGSKRLERTAAGGATLFFAMRRGLWLLGFVTGAACFAPACATGNGEADPPTDQGPVAITDADGDGFDSTKDCNDNDPAVHPGATEICNGKDDNCDGKVDEGFDKDGDGYASCATPSKKADCNDDDPAVHPGAAETCNEKDDDCDGVVDNGFDQDGDGFFTCKHADKEADCDDKDPKVMPGAKEVCNGKDDDCNGQTDEIPAKMTGLVPPLDAHWVVAGSASLATFQWCRLTDQVAGQAGALWWNAGAPGFTFDTFEVQFTMWIKTDPGGADGMGFAWVPGTDTTKVGSAGGGMGLYGLGGYGVIFDTYQNPNEPPAPFLVVMDGTTAGHLARVPNIPNVRDGTDHVIKVKVDGGKVSVVIDNTNYLSEFAIPGYTPFKGHWGFVGATGGSYEQHWVKDITVSFPKGQGCVP